jgi:hypothetical protein
LEQLITPIADRPGAAVVKGGSAGSNHAPSPPHQNIRVSQAVLDAAMKEGEGLLQSLQTGTGGLTQNEAGNRARKTGPNEVAQERQQSGFGRLLKITAIRW